MVWRLGTFQIRVKSHKFGVMSTGRAMVECFFVFAVGWSIYCTIVILGLVDLDSARSIIDLLLFAKYPFFILVLPTFFAMFVCFIICQIPIHNRIIEFKKNELFDLDNRLDQLNALRAEKLTNEVRDNVEFLEKKRKEVVLLPEWPFGFNVLLGAVGSSFTIILPTLVSSFVTLVTRSAASLPH
jgi:hypothetical protein